MNSTEREIQRERANHEELVERIACAIPGDGVIEPFPGLFLARASAPAPPIFGIVEPSLCVIAQGRKEMRLAHKSYEYDAHHYLLACLELPVALQVLEASRERPYLSLRLNLDAALVGSVLVEAGLSPQSSGDAQAIDVSALDAALLDAVLRLARLLDSPTEARLMLPLVTREIVYRLLVGAQGERLRRMTLWGGHTHRIAQVVEKICREFSQPLRIEELARATGMSVSGFHQHFKAVTALSPLQFQKQLRLREARRLLLSEHFDAATAGYQVGYEDASHFNRDYKRLFGEPPMRDLERLQQTAQSGASVQAGGKQ